jgi:quinohemoprotein ethanol dehydrogenase
MLRRAGLTFLSLMGVACGAPPTPGAVDRDRLLRDDEPGQWLAAGRTWRADRYSPLARIHDGNVDSLGVAWEYEFRSRRGRVEHGQESTPVVVDGVVYISGPWGSVAAVEGATGAERWRYDPVVDGSYGRRACCGVVNRGLAVWKGFVYVATLDGFLVALDAATGKEVWRADTFTDRSRSYTITGAPIVAGDHIVIGNSGGEYGVRGYLSAYNWKTGTFAWRFFTVPGDPAKGAEHPEMAQAATTWDPASDWASGLGGTVWGEMAYDPNLNLLYVGTGNSSPYPIWFRSPSGGDNLYLVSILAIRPDSGRLAWHYQQVPSEIWDYTATSNFILADLPIGKVIMQAPKNGIFYVLDRATGRFISGTPFVHVNWTTGIDSVTGRPALNPAADYRRGPALIFPTQAGGRNWQPMAYSHRTGLVYFVALEEGMVMWSEPDYKWKAGQANLGAGGALGVLPPSIPGATADDMSRLRVEASRHPSMAPRTFLVGWDPIQRRARWRRPLGTSEMEGSMLATEGNLVFTGTSDGRFLALSADSGLTKGEWNVGTGILAAPASYEVGGEQHVAVLAGYGGALSPAFPPATAPNRHLNYGRLLAFKLGGTAPQLPPLVASDTTPTPPPIGALAGADLARGQADFGRLCGMCHAGRAATPRSAYPDLHRMSATTHERFDEIVLRGALEDFGMASFADVLTSEDARNIHAYLRQEQARLKAEESRAPR